MMGSGGWVVVVVGVVVVVLWEEEGPVPSLPIKKGTKSGRRVEEEEDELELVVVSVVVSVVPKGGNNPNEKALADVMVRSKALDSII